MMSIVASGVLMLTVMNLMGLSTTQWDKGNDVREIITELSMTLENFALDVKSTTFDSIYVSPSNDTLNVGSTVSFYKDSTSNLVIERNGNTFQLLEGMVTNFSVDAPVVNTSGDTLNMVAVTLVIEKDTASDSTTVWLTPRL